MIANLDVIIEEKKWVDPYDSVWLKLVTILVYIIEGRHLSINIIVKMEIIVLIKCFSNIRCVFN